MTVTTWIPAFVFGRSDEDCAVCGGVLDDNYLDTVAVGVKNGGQACRDCVEQLPGEIGKGLWELAEGLTHIDNAAFELPQHLRVPMIEHAHDVLDMILRWRLGPTTDEEKADFVKTMAAQDKLLRLPGGKAVQAAIYDPEKHGPFLP